MSDGAIGNDHITIPDLLEPVVGFRSFNVRFTEAIGPWTAPAYTTDAWTEIKWVDGTNPEQNPFVEPREYVTDPATGRAVKNYKVIAKAFEKWQASLGTMKTIKHPAIEHPAIEYPAQEATFELTSPHRGMKWKGGVNEARCGAPWMTDGHNHVSPDAGCKCGLYSYYDANKVISGGSTVLAIVTQWGKIEAHATGMRSQYMKIEAVLANEKIIEVMNTFHEWDDVIKFKTGETSLQEFPELASEFGSPLPESMRPKELSVEDELNAKMARMQPIVQHHHSMHHINPSASPHWQAVWTDTPKKKKRFSLSKKYWLFVAGLNVVAWSNLIYHIA